VKTLVAAGADAARVHGELAGSRLPVVDPGDAKMRSRNERVEIVFVPAGR
jgi:outer membrane protein OmpA-like peptidoglycan-associated protein